MDAPRSYVTDVRVGESLEISGPVTLTLEQKSGQLARMRFQHDGGVTFRKLEPRLHVARMGLRVAQG